MFESNGISYDLNKSLINNFIIHFEQFTNENHKIRKRVLSQNIQIKKINKNNQIKQKKVFRFPVANYNEHILEQSDIIPKGFYFFPLKDNIIRDDNYELTYIELIEKKDFKHFCQVYGINEKFLFYPKAFTDRNDSFFDEKKTIKNYANNDEINKNFLLWIFIQSFNLCKKNNIKFKQNENLIKLIKFIRHIFKINFAKLFDLIYKYLNNIEKIVQMEQKKLMHTEIFNKYFCQFCNQYFCSQHFMYDIWIEKVNKVTVLKKSFVKLSGDNIYTKSFLSENKYQKYDYKCKNCKISQNFQELEKKNIFKILDQFTECDIYNIANFLCSNIITNECILSSMFNFKYNCNLIHQVIEIYNNKEYCKYFIEKYSRKNNFGLQYPKLIIGNFNIELYPELNSKLSRKYIINELDSKMSKKLTQLMRTDNSYKEQYIPCDHYGECTEKNCDCFRRGSCEKSCCCFLRKEQCSILYKGCTCKDGCKPISSESFFEKCECLKNLRECDPLICKNCNNKSCYNMQIYQKKFKKCFYAKSVLIDGGGLFADEDIKQFELIGIYIGEILTESELDRKGIFYDYLQTNYPFVLSKNFEIDAKYAGNWTRYMNHSNYNYENAFARTIFVRNFIRIGIFARCFIKRGEEIYFNYGNIDIDWVKLYDKKYKPKI